MSALRLLRDPIDGVPPVIATDRGLREAAGALAAGEGPVAVDAERASGHRYGQRAMLIQLRRSGTGTQLIDPTALTRLEPLARAMTGPEWILHAATQDLPCLRELGLRPERLFDTEVAARLLGLPKVGLASLTEELLGVSLAKGHGAADWSKRPLPEAWLTYAALDVELLADLRQDLIERLREVDRWTWAEQEFTALLDFEPRVHPEPWRRTSGAHKARKPRQAAILRALWQAREEVAEHADRAPGRILSDKAMVAGALAEPQSRDQMFELKEFRRTRRRQRWWGAVAAANALPTDQLPGRPEPVGPPDPRKWERRNPTAAQRLKASRAAILARAQELGIGAEVLVSPGPVRELCWTPPTDADFAGALAALGARQWQIDEVAPLLRGSFDEAHAEGQVESATT